MRNLWKASEKIEQASTDPGERRSEESANMPTPQANQPPCGCSSSSCEDTDHVSRRDFLHATGASLSALTLPGLARSVMAGPFFQPDDISHFVPADKELAAPWIASLTQRGKARICRGDDLKFIAMPVGGIAAGQLYLRGDGTLSCWQIFNQPYFSGYGANNYDLPPSTSPVEQGFALVIHNGDSIKVHRLSRTGFRDIAFTGRYPIATVDYADPDYPVQVQMEAFSPFIPLNAPDSALPATVFNVTIRNTSDKAANVAMLAWLENAVCFHNAQYLRAQIPVPKEAMTGLVAIRATFCYATRTDPQDPSNYTRSGLDVVFRPHGNEMRSIGG